MTRATLTASLRALEVIRDGNAAVLKAHGHVSSAFASTVITDNAILVTLELAAAVKAAAAGDTAPALAAVENLALHEMELR